jgi:signal transduction histidine kinase
MSDDLFYVIQINDRNSIVNQLNFISENVFNFYGLTKEKFIKNPDAWIEAIHPEDLESVFQQTNWMYTHKKSILRKYRIFNQHSQEYIWIHDKAKPILDDNGEMVEIYGAVKNVTDLKEKELELLKINEELIQIEETERSRISFELHDGLNQTLAVAKIQASIAQKTGNFNELFEILDTALQESKNIINNLTPKNLNDLGLIVSLQNLFSMIKHLNKLEIEFEFTKESKNIMFSDFQSFHIYRIIQEALNNTIKYSQATRFSLTIQVLKNYMISFQMHDNGIGVKNIISKKNNFLLSIRRRVTILKGTLHWKSSQGFQISVFIPFSDFSVLSNK